MTAGAYDLTTVAEAKAVMRLASATDDTLLQTLVTAVSDRIERLADRRFVARDCHEPGRLIQGRVQVRNWPVIRVDGVHYGAQNALSVQADGFLQATVQVAPDAVCLAYVQANGAAAATSLAFATYPTTNSLAGAISVVAGWSATDLAGVPSGMLNLRGGEDVNGRVGFLTWPDQMASDVRVIEEHGLLRCDLGTSPRQGARDVLVCYRAGYETVPADLEMVADEMVQELYERTKLNPALAREDLGDYVRIAVDALQASEVQKMVLARYREVR